MNGIGRSLTAAGEVFVFAGVALVLTIMFASPGVVSLAVGLVLLAIGGIFWLATGTRRQEIPVTKGSTIKTTLTPVATPGRRHSHLRPGSPS